MTKLFLGARDRLIALEKFIAAASLLLLFLFTLTQIIARNFFDTGFPQLDILSRHLVLFILFMGAALACEGNNHIKIDVLCAYMPQERKNRLLKPLFLLSAIITALLGWYAAVFWLDEWRYAASNQLPAVLMTLVLPLGFGVLSLHFMLLVLTDVNARKPSQAPASTP